MNATFLLGALLFLIGALAVLQIRMEARRPTRYSRLTEILPPMHPEDLQALRSALHGDKRSFCEHCGVNGRCLICGSVN